MTAATAYKRLLAAEANKDKSPYLFEKWLKAKAKHCEIVRREMKKLNHKK